MTSNQWPNNRTETETETGAYAAEGTGNPSIWTGNTFEVGYIFSYAVALFEKKPRASSVPRLNRLYFFFIFSLTFLYLAFDMLLASISCSRS